MIDRAAARLNAFAAAGCVLFALPLLAHAYAGTTSRYVGDDYCAGYIFRDHGFIGGQVWHYFNWGAVPTTLFLMGLTAPAGAQISAYLPAVALVAWVAIGAWSAREVSTRIGRPFSPMVALLVAELVVYFTLRDSPNIIQSLYARVPLFEYTGALISMTAYIGVIARSFGRPAGWRWLVFSAVLAFVAAGLGPTYAAMQTTALMIALALVLIFKSSRPRGGEAATLAAGLAGSIVSLAVIVLAPGNAVRQAYFPAPPSLFVIAKTSVLSTVFMFARPVLPLLRGTIERAVPVLLGPAPKWLGLALDMGTSIASVIVPIGLMAIVGFLSAPGTPIDKRASGRALMMIPVIACVLIASCIAPSVYGTGAPPPPRTLIIPQFALTVLMAVFGYIAGVRLAQRPLGGGARRSALTLAAAFIIAMAVWSPLIAARGTWSSTPALKAWAAQWDDTDQQLRAARAAGTGDARVTEVSSIGGMGSISTDSTDWVNTCAAHYYGLQSITGVRK